MRHCLNPVDQICRKGCAGNSPCDYFKQLGAHPLRTLPEFVIEADPLRTQLHERIRELEDRALEDYSTWLQLAHEFGAEDGQDMRQVVSDGIARLRASLHSTQDLLAAAERRWQRDIQIVEQETIEKVAKSFDGFAIVEYPSMTIRAMLTVNKVGSNK